MAGVQTIGTISHTSAPVENEALDDVKNHISNKFVRTYAILFLL